MAEVFFFTIRIDYLGGVNRIKITLDDCTILSPSSNPALSSNPSISSNVVSEDRGNVVSGWSLSQFDHGVIVGQIGGIVVWVLKFKIELNGDGIIVRAQR